jgi:hypothetical protein
VPLTVSRRGGRYSLWGYVRPAAGPTTVTVEARRRGSRQFKVLARVQTNLLGYWTLGSRLAAASWRVRWESEEGVTYVGPPIRSY